MEFGSQKHILVVDDDEHISYLLKFLLNRENYIVTVANDGKQALHQVEKLDPPDLVILDLLMPYVDGIQVIKHIRSKQEWNNVQIIVLSSNSQENDIVRALDCGANDFIAKPFKPEELVARLRRFIRTVA